MIKNSIKLLSASLIAALFGTSLLIAAPDSFAPIVKSEKNKVVHIATTTTIKRPAYLDPFFERFFPNAPSERKSNALGSGFFISSDGYIITNNHVVEGADKIQILTVEQKRYDAKVIGTDPRTDLALIKIEGTGFPAVKMGVSANLEIGDWVIAIGNPLGLDFTVTAGIVSAVERDLTLGGESAGSSAYGKFIQTDTAINFGNSGGPLFNTKGEVVGINTAISANGQGLSFAVPVDVAKNVINQLKSKGKVERGYIGIGIQDLTHEMKSGFSVPADVQGVLINNVGQGTPAEKSGLKQGDVVIEFNGIKTLRTGDLQQAVAETEINKEVPVKIYRDGKLQTVRVKVGMPENTADAPDQKTKKEDLGLALRYLNSNEASANGYPYPGALVTDVAPDGDAAQMIEKGDLIREINRRKFNSMEEFRKELKALKKNQPLVLLVYKPNRGNIYITIAK